MRKLIALSLIVALVSGCAMGMMSTEQARKVEEGMTETEVIEAYGKPMTINTTRTQGMTREQWVYQTPESAAGVNYRRVYVYFQDGRVTGVQY